MALVNLEVEGRDGVLHVQLTVGLEPKLLAVLAALVADPAQLAKLEAAIAETAAVADDVDKTLKQQAP